MRKNLLLLVLGLTLGFTSNNLKAQLPDGSIGANFTMVDYLGGSHTLYNYLDAGKPVIMDVSATWCGPCWSYHETGALDDLYTSYGPTGTNALMVLWIEGDGNPLTSLQGNTTLDPNTQGDWTAGTTFPMILTVAPNTDQVVTDYEIGYFPTVYRICPDRVVTEVGQLNAAGLKAACDACPVLPTTTVDAKLFKINAPVNSYCSPDVTPTVTIQNYGSAVLTSLTITSKVDGVAVGTPYVWGGSLDQFEVAQVTLPTLTGLLDGVHIFTAVSSLPNGVADEDVSNDTKSGNFAVYSNGAVVLVKVITDAYPSEVSWSVFPQGSATAVASNSRLNSGTNNTNVCLNTGCYRFTINDSYGDGMSSPGKVLITYAGDTLVYFLGTSYTETKSVDFCVTAQGLGENPAISSLSVYPNPFSSAANILVNLTAPQVVAINVYNLMGEVVYQIPAASLGTGEHVFEFNGNELSNGIYIVRMNVGDQILSRKIELSR